MSTKKAKPGTAFRQQQLAAWQPILTPQCVIPTLFIIGIIFIPVGIVLYNVSNNVKEVTMRYNDVCGNQTICEVSFDGLNMTRPLFIYYELTNFYQNHRRYVKSRSDAQLRGELVTNYDDLSSCEPYISLNNSRETDMFYLPCGLIAKSMFTDSFVLKKSSGDFVNVSKKGIAWESDVTVKYNNPPANSPGIRTIPDFKDEDFIVWMRTAGLPKFRKLYRIINEDLSGDYIVQINNNYDVSTFDGTKSIVISETSFLGGKNPFLGIAYMAVGSFCILTFIVFLITHLVCGRKQGDLDYIKFV